MDSFLITLVVIVIAALSNWLQQRAQGHGPSSEPGPDQPSRPYRPRNRLPLPRSRPAPAPESSLERELRRLLGEEFPSPTPQLGPEGHTPPTNSSSPAPPLLQPTPPKAALPHADTLSPILQPSPQRLSSSQAAYAHAQQLHASVAERLREIGDKTEKHGRPLTVKTAAVRPPAASPVFAIRSSRAVARQAFVASLVFGQPKAFEPYSGEAGPGLR